MEIMIIALIIAVILVVKLYSDLEKANKQQRIDTWSKVEATLKKSSTKAKKPVGRPRKDSTAKTGVEKGIENWNNTIKKVAKKTK